MLSFLQNEFELKEVSGRDECVEDVDKFGDTWIRYEFRGNKGKGKDTPRWRGDLKKQSLLGPCFCRDSLSTWPRRWS